MTESLKTVLPTIALVAALAMGPVAPEAGNTLFLVAGCIGLVAMWPEARMQVNRPIVWMPLLGVLLVGLAYGLSAGLDGLAGLAFFAPMLAIWPLVTLSNIAQRRQTMAMAGLLALCGASGAAIMALFEVQATGVQRAGEMVANPIHFADVALLVGFVALMAVGAFKTPWRFAFLIAPVMAGIAVVLSGTRGAIVAMVAMVVMALLAGAVLRVYSRRVMLAMAIAIALALAVVLALGGNQIYGIQRVFDDIAATLASGAPTDHSTSLRLQMYLGAFRAFLDSPVIGHGPLAFTAVADALADTSFGGAPHLHNDLADMAASAGIFGLTAYALFLAAPIAEAIRAPAVAGRRAHIVLAVTLVSGFFVMGLTNAMFGILTVTTAFAALCVVAGLGPRD